MKQSEIRTRGKNLAVKIFAICDELDTKKGRGVIINQLIRSSTSIGANAHEACYASSGADFINKLHISLKECYETEYWIDMLYSIGSINENMYNELLADCGIIRRMLVKSINTMKERLHITNSENSERTN